MRLETLLARPHLASGSATAMYNTNSNMASQSAGAGGSGADAAKLAKLTAVLDRFEISIAEANDLVALEDYEIVIIADDSGSMKRAAAPPERRQLGTPSASRWDELQETVALIVELGCCFDASGVDIFFLNRAPVKNVTGPSDPKFMSAFRAPPCGGTPLTEMLAKVASQCGGERPVLLFILTDGEPDGGKQRFCKELTRLVKRQSTCYKYRVQIMACTGDEDAVGWLDAVDREFQEVDVTDDYYSEMLQVLKDARKIHKFTRGDWCMKAMLGPISTKFDGWDERVRVVAQPRVDFGGKTAMLEEYCSCSSNKTSPCTIS